MSQVCSRACDMRQIRQRDNTDHCIDPQWQEATEIGLRPDNK